MRLWTAYGYNKKRKQFTPWRELSATYSLPIEIVQISLSENKSKSSILLFYYSSTFFIFLFILVYFNCLYKIFELLQCCKDTTFFANTRIIFQKSVPLVPRPCLAYGSPLLRLWLALWGIKGVSEGTEGCWRGRAKVSVESVLIQKSASICAICGPSWSDN